MNFNTDIYYRVLRCHKCIVEIETSDSFKSVNWPRNNMIRMYLMFLVKELCSDIRLAVVLLTTESN